MRKSQKVKRLRLAVAEFGTTLDRIATELDLTRLVFMKFQCKLRQPGEKFFQTGDGYCMALPSAFPSPRPSRKGKGSEQSLRDSRGNVSLPSPHAH